MLIDMFIDSFFIVWLQG